MAELVKDVVCGMDVDPDTAAAKSDYQGVTYYFCSEGCKQGFDADPTKYAGAAAPAAEAAVEQPAAAPAPQEAPAAAAPPAPEPVAAAPRRRWWEFWKT